MKHEMIQIYIGDYGVMIWVNENENLKEAIKEETQNVLIRSRIKPARGGTPIGWGIGFGDRPYLLVIVRCIQLSGSKSTVAAIPRLSRIGFSNNPALRRRVKFCMFLVPI